MNWIDFTIFGILFFAIVFGLASNPFVQFLRVCGLLFSFFAAFFFHGVLSNILKGFLAQSFLGLLSYFTIFGIVFIVTNIFTDLIKKLFDKQGISISSRFFSAFLGALKGFLFCGAIIFGVLMFCGKTTCDTVNTSKIATYIGKGMHGIVRIVPEDFSRKMSKYTKTIQGQKPERKKTDSSTD